MKIEKKIRRRLDESAPDIKDDIVSKIDWDEVESNNAAQKRKAPAFRFKALIAAASFVLICCAVIIPLALRGGTGVTALSYSVTIEINPSIRLEVGADDFVKKQYGLNEDGVVLLYKENLVGKNIDDATESVISILNSSKFLSDGKTIRVSVKADDGKQYKSKQDKVLASMQNFLSGMGSISLATLTDDDLDAIEDYYEDRNISDYERQVVNDFRDALIESGREKITEIKNLLTLLEPYVIDGDGIIPDFACGEELREYCEKYNYTLEFDIAQATYEDIEELYEELEDSVEELEDIIDEINEGADEDDYADMIEDLFELAKEILFGED